VLLSNDRGVERIGKRDAERSISSVYVTAKQGEPVSPVITMSNNGIKKHFSYNYAIN